MFGAMYPHPWLRANPEACSDAVCVAALTAEAVVRASDSWPNDIRLKRTDIGGLLASRGPEHCVIYVLDGCTMLGGGHVSSDSEWAHGEVRACVGNRPASEVELEVSGDQEDQTGILESLVHN